MRLDQRRRVLLVVVTTLVAGALAAPVSAGAAAPPTVTSVSPGTSGYRDHATVTVHGTGFTNVSKVTFSAPAGNSRGRRLDVVSPTKLTVVAPGHLPGTTDVRVWTAAGESAATAGDRFTFTYPAPDSPWSPLQAPEPTNIRSNNADPELQDVACADLDDCVAIGRYDPKGSSHNTQLVASSTAGTWSAAQLPLPADRSKFNRGGELRAVSCRTAGDCVVVGRYGAAHLGYRGLLLTLHDGSWTAVAAAAPSGAPAGSRVTLHDVSCDSDECVAVGEDHGQPVIETLSGTTWTAQLAPAPVGTTGLRLDAVSCPAAGSCVAVGEFHTAQGGTGHYAAGLTSGTWSATALPLPLDAATGQQGARMTSVSCGSPTFCAAAGQYHVANGPEHAGLLESLSGPLWAAARAPRPAASTNTSAAHIALNKVSCGDDVCAAVGGINFQKGRLTAPIIETLDGGTWTGSRPTRPDTATPLSNFYPTTAVSCAGSQFCVAGSWVDRVHTFSRPLFATFDGSTWTTSEAPLPTNTMRGGMINSVSCVAAHSCVAVGDDSLDNFADPFVFHGIFVETLSAH